MTNQTSMSQKRNSNSSNSRLSKMQAAGHPWAVVAEVPLEDQEQTFRSETWKAISQVLLRLRELARAKAMDTSLGQSQRDEAIGEYNILDDLLVIPEISMKLQKEDSNGMVSKS